MYLLKVQWEIMGLKAPVFSWLVSIGLILYSGYILYAQWTSVKRWASQCAEADKKVKDVVAGNPLRAGEGISIRVYDLLRDIFEHTPLIDHLWQKLNSHMIRRLGRTEDDEFWIGDSVKALLWETEIIDAYRLKGAPGIVTGVGLLFTFLAILVALLDVRLINNRVQGLNLLIQGLSGKFLSSIAALSCAVLLLGFERRVNRPAYLALSSLIASLSQALPQLSSPQILSDLHKDIAEQSSAFRIFNADLSLKLKQSFGESVGPTLERMVSAVENLNELLRKAEADKQQSMTDQLAGLLKSFEQSMKTSLEKMGGQFSSTLTGSAQGQFDRVADSLGKTASFLQEMNTQFAINQSVLNDLINLAKNSTTEQITNGQAQVEELAGVLKKMMVQLQEKTGESIGSVQQVLASVTRDVSNKVTEMAVQMSSLVEETSGRSTETARKIIEHAGTLSSQSAERLAKLLEHHSTEVRKVEDLSCLLDATIRGFTDSIGKYSEITGDLNKLVSEVNMTVTSMSATSRNVRDSQESSTKVAAYATEQINTLKSFNQNQKEIWEQVSSSMLQYESIFSKVDKQAKELLSSIGQVLQGYSETTQDHFNKLGTIANNHIADATARIAGSVDELKEQLDDLQGVVAGIRRSAGTMTR
jgi:methyl-accepting chemotaxis protein